jgi:hypothetical protein
MGDVIVKDGTEIRLGYTGSKVESGSFGGKPCLIFSTDAMTTQVEKFRGSSQYNSIESVIKDRLQVWVQDGRIVQQSYRHEDRSGIKSSTCRVRAEDLQLDVGGREMNVFPNQSIDLLHAAFAPMVRGEDVLIREKTFAVLDPLTGAFRNVKARVMGHFDWSKSTGSVKQKGHVIEYAFPDHVEKAYISFDGELLKVDLPAGRYLVRELEK